MAESSRERPERRERIAVASFGVVEDEHLRAEVDTDGARTRVRLEGRLEPRSVPVVDELLDAIERWHRGRGRHAPTDPTGGEEPAGRAEVALEVDLTAVEEVGAQGWEMLEHHVARWRSERGPCRLRGPRQGSRR
jgi:hypothetical protein